MPPRPGGQICEPLLEPWCSTVRQDKENNVNTLLAPAMALMNRPGYAMKFSLISALWFVPLIVVSGMLVNQAWDRVQTSRHALDSMELLEPVAGWLVDAETLRGLDIIAFHLGTGEYGPALEQRSSETLQRLVAGLENLPLDAADPEAAELLQKRDDVLAEYRAIDGASLRNRGQMSTQAHVGVVTLLNFSVAYSGLAHDYERIVRQLADLLVDHAPQITSVLGFGRATGAYSIGLGYLNSDASRDMDRLLEESLRLGVNYAQAQSFLQQPELEPLRAGAQTSMAGLERAQAIFEDEIILAATYDDTWEGYFQRLGIEMGHTHAFNREILQFLKQGLLERLGDGNRAMLTLVAALAAILALITWLYLGFYMATRRTIETLSGTMAKVAQGDLTARAAIISRDELGKLAGEFNGSIERIQGLVRHVSQTSGLVGDQSRQVIDISSESSQAVEGQRTQIKQVATAMKEVAATSQEVVRSAALAVTNAEQVNSETLTGRRMVETSVDGIEKLASEIENSVKVINNLADDSASISRVLD